LSTITEGTELAVDRGPTVYRSGLETGFFRAEAVNFFANLNGKLSGWAENQYLRVSFFDVDRCQGRKSESRGFTGASCGKAQNVFAGEGRWDGFPLNGRWPLVAQSFNRCEEIIGKAEL
jgi:hypothetical protein